MTTSPQAAKPSWAPDVDHEVSQMLQLYTLLKEPHYKDYPKVVRRAVREAFAAHFRVLMEFFHDSRPTKADWKRIGPESKKNVTYSQVLAQLGGQRNRFSGSWSKRDLERVRDADKLLAHLTEGRALRRRHRREWGGKADWKLVGPKLRHFLKHAQRRPEFFPDTVEAAKKLSSL